MSPRTFAIVNPEAGGGLGRREWPAAARELKRKIGPFDSEETEGVGHARILAHDATQAGYSLIIAYGGDGTIHEVANGMMESKPTKRPALGILSVGTGGDFIKTLNIPKRPSAQIRILGGARSRLLDVGRVEYTNLEGKKERRFFVNIADAGLGAEVVRRLAQSRKFFGRNLAYLSSTLTSYLSWPAREISITTDLTENSHWPEKIISVVVANGRYFGGGMPIAPTADPTDGYFDLVVVGALNLLTAALAVPLLYAKQLVRLPHVRADRVRSVTLSSPEPVNLDIDGEPIGSLPATFEVLPQALEVKTP